MIERIRRWWWHYQAVRFAQAEAKDRQVEAIRSRAIEVRQQAEGTRRSIAARNPVLADYRRSDTQLRGRR